MFEKIKAYLNLRYFLYFFALIAGWPCVFFLMGWLPHYTIIIRKSKCSRVSK